MSYASMWKYRGGPKNNGRWAMFYGWPGMKKRMDMGLNHRPHTWLERIRGMWLRNPKHGSWA